MPTTAGAVFSAQSSPHLSRGGARFILLEAQTFYAWGITTHPPVGEKVTDKGTYELFHGRSNPGECRGDGNVARGPEFPQDEVEQKGLAATTRRIDEVALHCGRGQ